ncbi:MAG: DNA-binding protein [Planctomycetes bacterium]|nr:DNA-binding protein [Planctomycetota bacterium]
MQVLPLPGFPEPVSAFTHLLGVPVFALLSIPLLRRARGDSRRVALLAVYAFACVLLLSMSGVYHMLPEASVGRAVMGRLDKAAIFVLIAGTHTPVQGLFFRGAARWGVLLALWLAAAAGITLFTIFYARLPRGLATNVYLLLGWIAGTSGLLVWRRIGTAEIAPLVLGGLAYSIGAILLGLGWPTLAPGVFGVHELWHFAVLAGMGLHWTFLFRNADRPLDG